MADFTYTANVKCVNGVDTWIELSFTNYSGTLGSDITAISITGPSGLITDDLNDFTIYEDTNYLWYGVDAAVPELGTYTFSVTIAGEAVGGTDDQTVNRTVPTVDSQTMIPAPGSSVPTDTTFEWTAVADPGYTVYYGIQIKDNAGDLVTNERYIGNFEYDINLPSGDYTWQIIVMDAVDWKTNNNRTHGNWEAFTVT